MERKYESNERAMAVAKQAVYLAWVAAGRSEGMGVFQDRGPNQDAEKVWDHAYNERDYSGGHKNEAERINCDYVMGRMMKLRFSWKGDTINVPDSEPRRDYQAWCGKYKSYADLFDAAEQAVKRESKAA